MRAALGVLTLACALAACASSGQTASSSSQTRRNTDVITADEIAGIQAQNAYEAVSRLRPRFLASQGGTTRSHAPQVVVDDSPAGSVDALRGIRADNILDIRYLNANDATMRWGSGYTGGAIVVRTVASAPK